MSTITGFSTHGFLTHDVRFPRSSISTVRRDDPFPDYSAAYLTPLAPGGWRPDAARLDRPHPPGPDPSEQP